MKKRMLTAIAACITIAISTAGCGSSNHDTAALDSPREEHVEAEEMTETQKETPMSLTSEVIKLEDGLSAVRFEGDDGFEAFLAGGGASSDGEVVAFLSSHLLADFDILGSFFGCSTIAVGSPTGDRLFGRNFDWNACDAMVVESHPQNGYASLSTVNMDFISQSGGAIKILAELAEQGDVTLKILRVVS